MQKESKSHSIWMEFLIVVSSFVLAFGTVTKLEAETRVSIQLGVFLAFLGSFFFVNITNLFNKLMLCTTSGLRFVKYFNLSLSDCMEISNKSVRPFVDPRRHMTNFVFVPGSFQPSSRCCRACSGSSSASTRVVETSSPRRTSSPNRTPGKIKAEATIVRK